MTSGKSELADKTPLVRANDCVVIDSAPCSWFGRKLTAMQGVTSGSQGPIRDRRDAVLMVAGGCLAFLFSVTAGIERWGGLDPIIEGLFIGLCSSLFSCAGAVLSLVLPAQSHWSAYSNLIGSCFAGAAAGHLVPDDKVLQLLALFSAIL